jgi:hypothetical protein
METVRQDGRRAAPRKKAEGRTRRGSCQEAKRDAKRIVGQSRNVSLPPRNCFENAAIDPDRIAITPAKPDSSASAHYFTQKVSNTVLKLSTAKSTSS